MRQWKERAQGIVALHTRPAQTVSVGANEVLILRKDGLIVDVVTEGRTRVRSAMGQVASWFGLGPKFDGYMAHTDPVKLSYWTEEPSVTTGLGSEAFGPPLITRDGRPIVAQLTVEVSIDPNIAERMRNNDDFPEPYGPTTVTNSPAFVSKFIPRKATTLAEPCFPE